MRHMVRLLLVVGVSLVLASAIPSLAAGDPQQPQSDQTTTQVKSPLQGRTGQVATPQATADGDTDGEPARVQPGVADPARDRSQKYFGENSVRKAWSWWQQGANGNTDDPEDGSDEEPDTTTPAGDGEDGDDDRNKVTICHIPPGNPANAHTISVSANGNAVNTHLNHGDTLGPCPGDESPVDP